MTGPIHSDTHRLGAGLSVRFTLTPDRLDAEWTPRTPTPVEWRAIQSSYRQARDAFMREVGQRMGRTVIVLEVAR